MIRFGTIGTNWIVDSFIKSGLRDSRFKLNACYSRNEDTALALAHKHNISNTFTSLEEMAESGLIDAVYIASPNAMHCEQAIIFLERKMLKLKDIKKTVIARKERLQKIREERKLLMP